MHNSDQSEAEVAIEQFSSRPRLGLGLEKAPTRCVHIFHCSLRSNGLTNTGAITLAIALKHNESLEELK